MIAEIQFVLTILKVIFRFRLFFRLAVSSAFAWSSVRNVDVVSTAIESIVYLHRTKINDKQIIAGIQFDFGLMQSIRV